MRFIIIYKFVFYKKKMVTIEPIFCKGLKKCKNEVKYIHFSESLIPTPES